MKNLRDHQKLAQTLKNKHGYNCKPRFEQLTGEAWIQMETPSDADEMHEVFGTAGYSFGYSVNK